ncbi:protein disulfide-isomerase a4 [Lasius niger]|uniref:Protein disulfide-isomerase a4 n=1 Tax=Lasius niger TaxID=67767 RepID=A0A0J7KPP7_LASNI|nr:protein disulfide-isomerase a4 [Lasius niger]
MGGKSAKPKIPSYEPYQCCPAKLAHSTKVAKVTKIDPIAKDKRKLQGTASTDKPQLPALKPINKLTAKESKKSATISKIDGDAKESKSKAKRGFFGSGKYYNQLREKS